jgi:hypothetical protein
MPARRQVHESLLELLLGCGADVRRIFDSSHGNVEGFARHIARARMLPTTPEPLIVLTKTSPVALSVFKVRRVLEEALPSLKHAPWIVFHDPDDDPFFGKEARSIGALDASIDAAPIWTTSGSGEYLVLVPGVATIHLKARIADLVVTGDPPP